MSIESANCGSAASSNFDYEIERKCRTQPHNTHKNQRKANETHQTF